MGCHTSPGFSGESPHDSPLSLLLPSSALLLPPTPTVSTLTHCPSFLLSFKDPPCTEAEAACHTPTLGGGGGDNDTVFSNSPTTDGMMWAMNMHCVFV